MRFSEFPFLRYTLFFVLGILLYPYLGFVNFHIYISLLVGLFIVYFVQLLANRRLSSNSFRYLLPTIAFMLLVVSGAFFTFLKDIRNDPANIFSVKKTFHSYMGVVLENDEQKANSISNRINLKFAFDGVNSFPLHGEILIYHRNEEELQPGEVILVEGVPQPISPTRNPGEFNYRNFMLRQQISHQHFVSKRLHKIGKVNVQPIESFFLALRKKILNHFDIHIQSSHANQIAKALLVGQRKNMDKDISNAYAATGAMHILAVSGLHVGIIYGFFFLLLKPNSLKGNSRVMYLFFIILLIWGYALLTGMAPSVMRAATMFTLVSMAQMKSRDSSIFNAIALSALLLLIFDPFLIYNVGFQLSYSALLGILLIQPLIVRLWLPSNKILEYAWQITAVSLAAQLATFPLSAYYFHIFPTYFVLSNLLAIPGAFLIMAFGVPFMVFVDMPFLSGALAYIVEKIILLLNYFIFTIQLLPGSQFTGLYLEEISIVFYAVILAMIIMLGTSPKKWQLKSLLLFGMLFGLFSLYQNLKPGGETEFVIYGLEDGRAMDFNSQNRVYFWQDEVPEQEFFYKVIPYRSQSTSSDALQLKSFGQKDSISIFLPIYNGYITLMKEQLLFSPEINIKNLHHWQNDQWTELPINQPLILGTSALKISLK